MKVDKLSIISKNKMTSLIAVGTDLFIYLQRRSG